MIGDEELKIEGGGIHPRLILFPPKGGEPRKHILEQISSTTHFQTGQLTKEIPTGNIVPACLEIFEHNKAGV